MELMLHCSLNHAVASTFREQRFVCSSNYLSFCEPDLATMHFTSLALAVLATLPGM